MEAVKEKVGGFGLSRRDSRTFIHEFAFRVSYMGFCVNYRAGIEGVQAAIDQRNRGTKRLSQHGPNKLH